MPRTRCATGQEPSTAATAGLASQIVFGTLRFQSQLDYLIRHYSGRDASKLDSEVRLALRMALFQLRYLERVPSHAVVHETVELVKYRKRPAAGLTNAVLRKVGREAISWPDAATDFSCPTWLLERWGRHFGSEQAAAIARAALSPPPPYITSPAWLPSPGRCGSGTNERSWLLSRPIFSPGRNCDCTTWALRRLSRFWTSGLTRNFWTYAPLRGTRPGAGA